MIQVLLLGILLCVSSIFYPALRKLAVCLITTAAVIMGGIFLLVEMVGK